MKILQVAPIYESIPPEKYGGAEEMIYFLIQGLIEKKHNVSLIASADSQTKAKLISVFSHGYNHLTEHNCHEQPKLSYFGILFQDYKAYMNKSFEIIHNHFYGSNSYGKLVMAKAFQNKIPTVVTLHNEVDIEQIGSVIYNEFADINHIFLSNAQRERHAKLKSAGVIYNSVDTDVFAFSDRTENFYYWISKINPMKGTLEAIEAAQNAKIKLILSGTPDLQRYKEYWEKDVVPKFNKRNIIFDGEANLKKKKTFYQNAKAVIFPSRYKEGCPMVPLESLSCGTPVIAFDNPVLMEIIQDGYNGFICKDVSELIIAIKRIESMSQGEYKHLRENCRQTILTKFSIEKMIKGYEKVYQKVIKDWKKNRR